MFNTLPVNSGYSVDISASLLEWINFSHSAHTAHTDMEFFISKKTFKCIACDGHSNSTQTKTTHFHKPIGPIEHISEKISKRFLFLKQISLTTYHLIESVHKPDGFIHTSSKQCRYQIDPFWQSDAMRISRYIHFYYAQAWTK